MSFDGEARKASLLPQRHTTPFRVFAEHQGELVVLCTSYHFLTRSVNLVTGIRRTFVKDVSGRSRRHIGASHRILLALNINVDSPLHIYLNKEMTVLIITDNPPYNTSQYPYTFISLSLSNYLRKDLASISKGCQDYS